MQSGEKWEEVADMERAHNGNDDGALGILSLNRRETQDALSTAAQSEGHRTDNQNYNAKPH